MAIDGLRVNNLCGSGQYSGFYMNDAAVQELTYSTGSEAAEIQSSGIRVNSVPKDGGNKFSGSFFLYGQGSSLQSDNRTDAMKAIQANGLPLITIAGTAYDWQINPSFGGPLVKDKLWFYADLQVPEGQALRAQRAFRRRQPGVPRGHGELQRHRPPHVGGLEQGQDSRLRREAVHRRVLQRLRHPADLDARGVDRRLRVSAGSRRPGGRARNRTSCCSKPASPSTTRRTRRTAEQRLPATTLPKIELLDRPADGQVRLHDSAVREHDQGLQRDGVGQLRHRLARDEVRHDRPAGARTPARSRPRRHRRAAHYQHGRFRARLFR